MRVFMLWLGANNSGFTIELDSMPKIVDGASLLDRAIWNVYIGMISKQVKGLPLLLYRDLVRHEKNNYEEKSIWAMLTSKCTDE